MLADKVAAVHSCLKVARIPHAFGGALALGHYAQPREAKDIDVNVFIGAERWPEVRNALAPLGIDIEADASELKREGQVKLEWEDHPLHLFFSCDPLHEEMAHRVRDAPFDGGAIPLVAPEHLVIRKAILNRPKDHRDIEQILAHNPSLDRNEVADWVRRIRSGWK